MTMFRFEAAQDDGRLEKGEIEADTARAARTVLRSRGLVPISVAATTTTGDDPARSNTRAALRESELALATRQLASLLGAGLPLEAALTTLTEQTAHEPRHAVFREVRADVMAGHRLADALARHPRSFPPIYCGTVAAGEQAGSFATVLERLARYLEERQALRARLIAAATYPVIVTVVALGIVLFLMTYVVPQVVQVFEHTRQVLPWPTRVLLAASSLLRVAGLPLLLALAGGIWIARTALRRPGPKAACDRLLLRLPVVGPLVRGIDTARFASTLAMLTEAGVPLLRALAAAEATVSNTVLRQAVSTAVERVREGSGLARALAQSEVFPPVLIRLTDVGEATGELPKMLAHAADNETRAVERRATAAAALLEPMLILVMGAVVLGIVLAVLMPIIEINQLVR